MPPGQPFDDIRNLVASVPGADSGARRGLETILSDFSGPTAPIGRLQDTVSWLAEWQGKPRPSVDRPLIAVFVGTHGVQGISPGKDPVATAKARVASLTDGEAGVRGIAGALQAAFKVYEMGLEHPSADMTAEASLSERDCAAAIAFGMEVVAEGADIIAIGSAGFGAATAAAAIALGLYGGTEDYWAGGSDAGAERRIEAVGRATHFHRDALSEPLEVLRRFGGRDLAGIFGAILAARHQMIPVVLDGYVTCAAAAVLHKLNPDAIAHCLAGHLSAEPAHGALLERMGLKPLHNLEIGVGDGTGAAMALSTLRMGVGAVQSMS